MNEIEQKFYDSWCECDLGYIEPSVVIGPYRVDFLIELKYVLEIDGHESHKTKEQRNHDYKRERYLQKEGYHVIRFTGTEVFLEPQKCAEETKQICDSLFAKLLEAYEAGSSKSSPVKTTKKINWRKM